MTQDLLEKTLVVLATISMFIFIEVLVHISVEKKLL
jgi:hypothetical protein